MPSAEILMTDLSFAATQASRSLRGRNTEGFHFETEEAAQPKSGIHCHFKAGDHLR